MASAWEQRILDTVKTVSIERALAHKSSVNVADIVDKLCSTHKIPANSRTVLSELVRSTLREFYPNRTNYFIPMKLAPANNNGAAQEQLNHVEPSSINLFQRMVVIEPDMLQDIYDSLRLCADDALCSRLRETYKWLEDR